MYVVRFGIMQGDVQWLPAHSSKHSASKCYYVTEYTKIAALIDWVTYFFFICTCGSIVLNSRRRSRALARFSTCPTGTFQYRSRKILFT